MCDFTALPSINNKYDKEAYMCLLVAESVEIEFGEFASLSVSFLYSYEAGGIVSEENETR